MPPRSQIGGEFFAAMLYRDILPGPLPSSDFAYRVRANRRDRTATVRFRIRYPQRTYRDVLPMLRGIESAFTGLVSYDLVETEGRAARRYPLTLVLRYGGEE